MIICYQNYFDFQSKLSCINRIRLKGPKTDPSPTPTFLEILCYICNIVLLEISMMMLQKVWDDDGFYLKIMRMHV